MSIESNLKSIAESLAIIAAKLDHIGQAVDTVAPEAPKPVAAPVAAPSAVVASPSAPATPVGDTKQPAAAPASSQPAPAAPATMTVEELNNTLVVEFHRLGGRDGIDKAMADLGASSVNQLAVDQYSALINAVKAL